MKCGGADAKWQDLRFWAWYIDMLSPCICQVDMNITINMVIITSAITTLIFNLCYVNTNGNNVGDDPYDSIEYDKAMNKTIMKIVFVFVMLVWLKRMVLVLVIVVVLIHRSAFTMHCQIDAKAPGWIGDGGFDTLPSIQTSALTWWSIASKPHIEVRY